MRVLWSPLAQTDIGDIWEYSFENWGFEQADQYIADIRRTAQNLAERHSPRRPCDHIRKGYFRAVIASHILFYTQAGEDIDVKRILHQSMDFQRYL